MEAPVVNNTQVPTKASDTVSLDLGGIGKLIYQYVLVSVIMLALVWVVLSLFNRSQEQKTTVSTTSAVRLTASASAAHPQVYFVETELAATQYPHQAPPVDGEEADVPPMLTTEIPSDDSTLDSIIDESIIDDDAMSAPVEEEQAVDTSVELVTEVHRDTRERRFPLFSRIQQRRNIYFQFSAKPGSNPARLSWFSPFPKAPRRSHVNSLFEFSHERISCLRKELWKNEIFQLS